MFKISKKFSSILMLSVLLFVSGCGSKKTSSTKKTSTHTQTSVEEREAKLNSYCYCPVKHGTVGVTHFNFDSSAVLPNAQELIENGISECVAKRLTEDSAVKVLVTGHADKRGTQEYNIALGTRRADATKNYLFSSVKNRVGAENVSADRFCVNSKGKEELVDSGDTEEAHAKNRRTVIEFVEECH